MKLENRFPVRQRTDDLNFSSWVAHGIAKGFAKAVLPGLGLVHYAYPFRNGNLEVFLNPSYWAALEHIIRRHANAGQVGQKFAQYLTAVVHSPQQYRLIADLYPSLDYCLHRPDRLGRDFSRMIELCDDV